MITVFRWAAVKGDLHQTYLLIDHYVFTLVTGGTLGNDVIGFNFVSVAKARDEAIRFTASDEQMGWTVLDSTWVHRLEVDAQRLIALCERDIGGAARALTDLEEAVVNDGEELG